MSGWQPIETAPKDGTSILISTLGSTSIASWNGRGHWNLEVDPQTLAYDSAGEIQTVNHNWVTHWMPLPAPPVEHRSKSA